MQERTLQTFAGAAAFVVGLSSLIFGLVFLFGVPDAQKGPAPNALTSYAANPTAVQFTFVLVIIGSLAALLAIVGIYRRLSEKNPGWALLSLILGVAFSILTALDATYTAFLFPSLSNLYATGDAAIKASAVIAWNIPSPVNPYDFAEFFLSGLWLIVTGWLIIRSDYFARIVGYLALVAGIGQIVLFVSTFTGTLPLILGIGVPGAVVAGPVFWLWIGYILWTKKLPTL